MTREKSRRKSIGWCFTRQSVIVDSMSSRDITLRSCGIGKMIGIPPVGRVNCRWLHFDDIAGEKVTIGHPEYLFMNETP